MASIRGSTFKTFVIKTFMVKTFVKIASCMLLACVAAPVAALAQHAPGHTAVGGAHVSAPPISRAPVLSAPTSYTPISAPRISAASPARALGSAGLRPPRRPVRPFPPVFGVYVFPPVFGGPFWGVRSCWWGCDFWSIWGSVSEYVPPNYLVLQAAEAPTYMYIYGEERPDLPQLCLKDGTIVSVTDYWVVDGQLHFAIIQEDGGNPEEQVIPFDALDLQKTVDLNTRRGFRFVLRNEPFEQYLRDHPDVTPPAVAPAHE